MSDLNGDLESVVCLPMGSVWCHLSDWGSHAELDKPSGSVAPRLVRLSRTAGLGRTPVFFEWGAAGQQRRTAKMNKSRQPASVSADARRNWHASITRLAAPTIVRKPQAQPASFQSTDIGSSDSSLLLRRTPLESPSVWQFRSVKNVGLNRASRSTDKSQT